MSDALPGPERAPAADARAAVPDPQAGGALVPLVLSGVSGAAVMAVELAAVRLLGPWYGTSLTVWTNVIAVILLALSVGYLAGARAAATDRPLRTMGFALLLGGALVAALPLAVGPVGRFLVPGELSLHSAAGLLSWGSLAASGLLFLAPALLLGTVPPLAVECVARARGGHAGSAGGAVLAVGTLGSLVGTFGASHLAVPHLGVARSFALFGALLLLSGALALWRAGAGRLPIALAAGLIAGAAWLEPSERAQPEGVELLASADSAYQRVRVVERAGAGPDQPAMRFLQVNEGSDSFQSAWWPELGLLPDGYYYNDFALPFAWTERLEGAAPVRWRAAILGLGGGTAWRVLAGTTPETTELRVDGVELDPLVVELAAAHMDLPLDDPRLRVHSGIDARVALRALEGDYDLLILDCYANQIEIPPHLASVEFLKRCRAALRPGGWLMANVGGYGLDDPVIEALGATIAAAFGQPTLALPVPSARNVTLVARVGELPPAPGDEAFWLDGELGLRLLGPRELPGRWRWITDQDGPLLTDDRSPLPLLERRSLLEAAERLGADLTP